MPHWLKTTLGLFPIVVGASAVAVAGLIVFRQAIPIDDLRGSTDAVGNYMQTVGGIYAVLLAFIVFVVWGQFNDGRNYVEREATAIVDLHRTASGLPTATRKEIQSALQQYVDAVLAKEWVAMATRDEDTLETVGHHLDQVWTAIHACKPANDCQHTVFSEILSRFSDLTDTRTSRLTSSRTRIPMLMKLLLYLGGIFVIGSIYLMAVDKFWVHAVITGSLAGAVAHIVFLILDLDNAFAGHLQVSKAAFVRAQRTFERAAHQADSIS